MNQGSIPEIAGPPTGQGNIPVEVLEQHRRVPLPPYADFCETLLEIPNKFWRAVEADFRLLHARHAIEENYLKDKQFLDVDPRTNEVYEVRPDRKYAHINNQFAGFIDAAVASIAGDGARLVAKSRTRDRRKKQGLRDVQFWLDGDRPFTQEDRLIIAYMLKLRGRAWFATYPLLDGPSVRRPVMGTVELGGGAPAYYCHDCSRGGIYGEPGDQQTGQRLTPQLTTGETSEGPTDRMAQPPGPSSNAPGIRGADPGVDLARPGSPPAPPADAPTLCPHCGSTNVETTPAPVHTVDRVTGYEERPSIRAYTEVVDDIEMRWFVLMRKPVRSPWLERVRFVLFESLQEKFPWLAIPPTTSVSNQQYGVQGPWLEEQLTAAVGAHNNNPYVTSGYARSAMGSDLRREFREVWLEPHLYGHLSWATDIQLANGKVIPANTPLRKVFPDGLYMAWVGNVLCDLRNENKEWVWTDIPHKLSPSGGFARASEPLVALQNRLNLQEVYGLIHLVTQASGLLVYNAKKIRSAQLRKRLGQPGAIAGLDGMLPNDRIDTSMIARVQPAALSADPQAAASHTIASQQGLNATYVTSPAVADAGGAAGNLDTATGVDALQENIRRINEPMTRLCADGYAKIAGQRFRWLNLYGVDPVWVEPSDPAGKAAGRMITLADIDGTFDIEPDPDAYNSRTNAEKRRDLVAAIGSGAYDPNAPKEQRRAVQKTFGLDDMFEADFLRWQEKAYTRLDAMKDEADALWPTVQALLQMVEQQMALEQATGAPPILDPRTMQPVDPKQMVLEQIAMEIASSDEMEETDRDDVFLTVIEDYKSTAEADEDNPLTRLVIRKFFLNREQHMAEEQVRRQTVQMAAAAPLMAMQGAAESATKEEDAARDERSKDRDANRKERAAQADHARNKDLHAMKAGGPNR